MYVVLSSIGRILAVVSHCLLYTNCLKLKIVRYIYIYITKALETVFDYFYRCIFPEIIIRSNDNILFEFNP